MAKKITKQKPKREESFLIKFLILYVFIFSIFGLFSSIILNLNYHSICFLFIYLTIVIFEMKEEKNAKKNKRTTNGRI